MNNTQTPFENRVRFNWGYHDGAAHQAAGRSKDRNGFGVKMSTHYDQVYAAGFSAGFDARAAGGTAESTETSDAAWAASGLKNGNSLKPHKLMGRDQKGRKIAPWMVAA